MPITIFVDEPPVMANRTASFHLVLSGLAGFGRSAGGEYREHRDED